MMNAAFGELGLDWRYLALAVPPALFAETVRALHGSGYRAANVTIPHKVAARELADELSPEAEAIGAVNTLTLEPDGRIRGDNTDGAGLLDALGEPVPATALVLGAGRRGARGRMGAPPSGDRGGHLEPHGLPRQAARGASSGSRPSRGRGDAELLVNATSVGLRREDSLEGLPLVDARVVADLVYGDNPTPFAGWAEERGARLVDGLEVLVRQGARSLAIWTGLESPVDLMRRAVVQAASSTSAQV